MYLLGRNQAKMEQARRKAAIILGVSPNPGV